MANVEDILRAAKNADAAGDTDSARRLVQFAKSMMNPQGDLPPPTAAEMAAAPRKAEFGDVAAEMVEEPWAAAKSFGAGITRPMESPLGQRVDEGGYYIPGLSEVGVGAMNAGGAALSGVQTALAGGAGLVGDAVNAIPGIERMTGRENSGQALANDLMGVMAVGVPELAGVSSVASRSGGLAKAAMKADTKLAGPAKAASDLGITPSLGMTGKTGAMVAAGLEKIPVAGSIIAKDAARAAGEIRDAFGRIIPGGVSPGTAGETLQKGLRKWADNFYDASSKRYAEVGNFLKDGARVHAPNFIGTIDDAKAVFAENPELAKKLGLTEWDRIAAEAGAKGMSWRALSDLRSSIGEGLKNRGALKDQDTGRLKRLYAALSSDMEAAAKAAGPKAYSTWRKANDFHKTGVRRIERSLDATISAKSPERAFEAFDAITQADRAAADVQRMREIKTSLKSDEWTEISQSIVARLGKAKPGAQGADGDVFSPATFLTEWNKMSPEARAILLDEPVRIELEKLAKVAETFKAGNAERNFSNTGSANAIIATLTGMYYAPKTTAAGLVTATLGAKAFTSPLFLRAVNSAAKGDMKALEAMAKGKGPYATDARFIMNLAAQEAQSGDAANSPTAPRRVINR